MCRMFALVSRKPRSASYWFFEAKTPFKEFSEKRINRGPHNGGWGVAHLSNGKWKIFKEGHAEVRKYSFGKIKKIKANKIMIHLRNPSVGDDSTRNAHPFKYKNWVFEHNGSMDKKKLLAHLNDDFKKKLTSQTDSEIYFYLIMQKFEKSKEITKSIKETVKLIRKYKHKGINFILSSPDFTYVFRDVSKRHKDLYSYYCLHYLKKKDEVVIASDPLSEGSWKPLNLGNLLVIDRNLKTSLIKI